MSPTVLLGRIGFYAAVVLIVVISVFPFYYAILTSFKTGTAIFEVTYWPTGFDLANYNKVLTQATFPRNLLNSLFVATDPPLRCRCFWR